MQNRIIDNLEDGFRTAYIDAGHTSNLAYKPSFISNNRSEGKRVLSSIEDELRVCESFQISVAFITMSGIEPLLMILKELERKGVCGQILTTNYLDFTQPQALDKLNSLKNITLRMYDVEAAGDNFHTKGYIFKENGVYRIIIGSSNITATALSSNKEWNTRIVSTEQGEIAKDIINEFDELWNSEYSIDYYEFIEAYRERYLIIRHQHEAARDEDIPSLERYKLRPNAMQERFVANLKQIISAGEERALLISATGTGKTYASAFAMRELGYKRVLFLVHRGQLARQTIKSYERVFGKSVSMGLVGSGGRDYNADYVFATIQTLNRPEHLYKFKPEAFECIVLDEAHHTTADTYQRIIQYFKPRFWLGMTATPDKRDDNREGKNIYELFHYQIAYEIRLQQAMEEKLLCPFHYFGISDLAMIDDASQKSRRISYTEFRQLTSDQRVEHIIEQAIYYGYSGDRVKGLVFCSRLDESEELSVKFNELGYRTIALNGSASEEERSEAFERLAMDSTEATRDRQPLDYIFSVEILNEGVDIVEVNQVIMLRPTQSPIVFIQQLGRGLRKAEGKEFVVILDFIGNYTNNFMIPVALSGDRTYNPDTVRKYVISGNNTIPGVSTVHFDEVAKEKIFSSIDKLKGIKAIIRESYVSLKSRLGRIPYLIDFYDNGEIDPIVIIREYKTYFSFLETVEEERYIGNVTEQERLTLEYLSRTVLNGTRPSELLLLRKMIVDGCTTENALKNEALARYDYVITSESMRRVVENLEGRFVSKEEDYRSRYCHVEILHRNEESEINRLASFTERLSHSVFKKQVSDIVETGLRRYREKYYKNRDEGSPFVLYEKYTRRDVSFLSDYGKDQSSVMYGKWNYKDDVFLFVTYHKQANSEESIFVEGKPDYADQFEDNLTFRWDSQLGSGIGGPYVRSVCETKRKHLLVKKSDSEQDYYYMGQFDIMNVTPSVKKDKTGKEKEIAKLTMRMHHAVHDDLLRYLESRIEVEGAENEA